MIRFLFRVLASIALAVAAIFAVLDATRTLAASKLVTTPLAVSWQGASPDTMQAVQDFTTGRLSPGLWSFAERTVLAAPGFAVFAALALLFFAIGRRRTPRLRRAHQSDRFA